MLVIGHVALDGGHVKQGLPVRSIGALSACMADSAALRGSRDMLER